METYSEWKDVAKTEQVSLTLVGNTAHRSGENFSTLSTEAIFISNMLGFKKAVVTCTTSVGTRSSAWIKVNNEVVESISTVNDKTFEIDLSNATSFSCGATSNNDEWITSVWNVVLTNESE